MFTPEGSGAGKCTLRNVMDGDLVILRRNLIVEFLFASCNDVYNFNRTNEFLLENINCN